MKKNKKETSVNEDPGHTAGTAEGDERVVDKALSNQSAKQKK